MHGPTLACFVAGLRILEKAADQGLHRFPPLEDGGYKLVGRLIEAAFIAVCEQLRVTRDHTQRCLQVMADHMGKLQQFLVRMLEGGKQLLPFRFNALLPSNISVDSDRADHASILSNRGGCAAHDNFFARVNGRRTYLLYTALATKRTNEWLFLEIHQPASADGTSLDSLRQSGHRLAKLITSFESEDI